MPPRPRTPRPLVAVALGLGLAAAAGSLAGADLAELEADYAALRELRDTIEVTEALGAAAAPDGTPLAGLAASYALRYATVARAASAPAPPGEEPAMSAIRAALAGPLPPPAGVAAAVTVVGATPDVAETDLRRGLYAAYGAAQEAVRYGDETIDRLTVFARLAATGDRDERRRLFLALEPVWRSMAGDGSPASDFRRLVAQAAPRWQAGDSAAARNTAALGVHLDDAERWLLEILAAWRDATAGETLEPWDLHHSAGAAARALAGRADRLRPINDGYYAALGADPEALGVRFDLAPREGKTPVAFTTFGRRPRRGTPRRPGEAWVFATYRVGGFDNLVELLHETGHAVHVLGIDTRPAFADWPDSDTFTEALADLPALEAYEVAWQERWLGAAAAPADNLRGKYGGIVLDICWALLELRLYREPALDPNAVWTELTRDYLHVAPHPEWSWWAMRGQLIDSPGYMLNYALGAVLVADLRARVRELRGPLHAAGADTWPWLAEHLYRFGLERSSREVVEAFLGRPLSPAALLAELRGLAPGDAAAPRPLALVGGTLVDLADGGRRGRDLVDATVVVEGGRVVAAGRRDEVTIPDGARQLDVRGRFLLPGLIDAFAGMNSPAQARAYLHAGVTSIVGVEGERRGPLALAARPRPRVHRLASVGYGDDGEPEIEPASVRRRVDRLAAEGVRVLLLMYPLPAESVAVAVARARELGLGTIGELGATPYSAALAQGVQAFVHTSRYSLPLAPAELRARVARQPFGPPKLEYYRWLIAHHGDGAAARLWGEQLGRATTALVPTLAMEYLDLPGHANPWREAEAAILTPAGIHLPADPATGERLQRPGEGADAFPAELAATLLALESTYAAAGARYLAGSGTSAFGTLPGISLRHELELLARIGLTPRQALAAATTNFGAAFGWRDVGCLAPGCRADLLVLPGDPTRDLAALRDLELVVLDGEPLDRAALLAAGAD